MHDPKFEKEVQQKMTELEFSPSESVWANVEKEINQLHTRRSFPFFWRLALPALLLLAGGGYYFFRSKPAPVSPAYPVAATSTHANPAAPATSKGATSKGANSETTTSKDAGSNTATEAATSTAVSPAPPASAAAAPTSTAVAPTSAASASTSTARAPKSASAAAPVLAAAASAPASSGSATSGLAARPSAARPSISSKPGEGEFATSAAAHNNTSTTTHPRNTPATASSPHRVNRTTAPPAVQSATEAQSEEDLIAAAPGTGHATMGSATKDGLVTTTTGTTGTGNGTTGAAIAASPAARQSILYSPALANLNASTTPIHASRLATKNTIAIKTLQSPHRPWEAAFAGGIGVSSLHQVQISNVTLNNAASSFTNTAATNTVTYAAARPSKQYVSTVKPGISFWAGVLANKPLSDRWSLSLGLNLYYYSTRVRVGEQVNTYTPSTQTLLTSSAVAPIQSYPYYSTGNDQAYTNRYYFMELPVAAEWKINRSHLLPLFWDGGFSVSYLMGSSAVYYNTKSGVYFKDGGVANHTQLNVSTALMVGLPVRGLRVQVGPQIQYGLTPLLNTELSGTQHIFYGGLRLVVYPGKK